MKKVTTIVIAAALVIGMGLLLAVYLQGGATGEAVTADLTIELGDAPASIHPGNRTVWTHQDGEWAYTTEANGGSTVWTFEGLPSRSNCYDQLMAAAAIAGFTVDTEAQPLGLLVVSIDGLDNNEPAVDDGKRAWQFYVDGVYGTRACNITPVAQGGEVVWKYIANQFS